MEFTSLNPHVLKERARIKGRGRGRQGYHLTGERQEGPIKNTNQGEKKKHDLGGEKKKRKKKVKMKNKVQK